MGKKLRAYTIAEKAMKYADGKANYFEILEKAKKYCSENRSLRFLFSHVNDDYVAKCLAGKRI